MLRHFIQTPFSLKKGAPPWCHSGRSRAHLLLGVALVASAISATPMAWSSELEAVRLWRAPDHTRIVLDLSDAVDFETLTLLKYFFQAHRNPLRYLFLNYVMA